MINLDRKLSPELYTEEPRCPYCGASYADWYNEPDLRGDGSRAYLECEACGYGYIATAYLVTRFTSRKVEEHE